MEPFLGRIKPAEFNQIKVTLQQKGVSPAGVTEFLAGRPVNNSADRLKLAAVLVERLNPRRG